MEKQTNEWATSAAGPLLRHHRRGRGHGPEAHQAGCPVPPSRCRIAQERRRSAPPRVTSHKSLPRPCASLPPPPGWGWGGECVGGQVRGKPARARAGTTFPKGPRWWWWRRRARQRPPEVEPGTSTRACGERSRRRDQRPNSGSDKMAGLPRRIIKVTSQAGLRFPALLCPLGGSRGATLSVLRPALGGPRQHREGLTAAAREVGR